MDNTETLWSFQRFTDWSYQVPNGTKMFGTFEQMNRIAALTRRGTPYRIQQEDALGRMLKIAEEIATLNNLDVHELQESVYRACGG